MLIDPNTTTEEKEAAFGVRSRKKWLRGIVYTDTFPPQTIAMPNPRAVFIRKWDEVGIVTQHPGPADSVLFPEKVWVETGRKLVMDPEDMAPDSGNSLLTKSPRSMAAVFFTALTETTIASI